MMTLAFLWGVLVTLFGVAGTWNIVLGERAFQRNVARGERPNTLGWSGGDTQGVGIFMSLISAIGFLAALVFLK